MNILYSFRPLKPKEKIKSNKFMNSKVTFDSGFGTKKSQTKLVDERFKTIPIKTGDNKIAHIWCK